MFFPPELTSSFVLEHVAEEEIYEAFGLPVQREKFRAPYRPDRKADCKFYRSPKNGRLYFNDYAGHFHGDCFAFVQFMEHCNFDTALRKIAAIFKLMPSSSSGVIQRKPVVPKVHIERLTCSIRVKRMEWTDAHRAFWDRWDFNPITLRHFKITPVERVWVNDKPVFWYGYKKEIAFCYWFGDYDYKIYFPTRTDHRFLHNNPNILQGYTQLPSHGEYLLITKSYKDVAKLYEFGIPAVAPMAETQILSQDQYEALSARFPLIWSLYDIDKPSGIKSMQRMKREYGIRPLFFPRRMPKDFTDFYEKYRRDDTLTLIQQVKDTILN